MAIKYNFGEISSALGEVQKLAEELESILSDIDGDVKKLAETWHGQGKEGWQALQTKWQGTAKNDVSALGELIGAAHSAVDDMKATSASVKEQFA